MANLAVDARRAAAGLGKPQRWNAVHRLGLSFKNALRTAEQDRPTSPRGASYRELRSHSSTLRRLVFLDETGISTKMARLAKQARWHAHFTPTSASWINQVERFFGLLIDKAIRRGVRRSAAELEAAIHAYIDVTNAGPKPFRWTKSPDDILASINRFCLRTIQSTQTSESAH